MSSSASLASPSPSAQHFCPWWGFAGHLMGKQELRHFPSVQEGDKHLCSKLSPQLFQISSLSIYTQSGFGWLRCLVRHGQSHVCFVWVPSKVWGGSCLVWAKLLMWMRRSFGQSQEGWWGDSCPPGEVERNSHRCLWDPLLLPLESSQSSSITPQEQNTSAAAGQWWAISQGLHLPRGVQGNVLPSLQLCYLTPAACGFLLSAKTLLLSCCFPWIWSWS